MEVEERVSSERDSTTNDGEYRSPLGPSPRDSDEYDLADKGQDADALRAPNA